jgi:hypothetical protein
MNVDAVAIPPIAIGTKYPISNPKHLISMTYKPITWRKDGNNRLINAM